MSESKKHNLDKLIQEAMEEKIGECPLPLLSATEAWVRMEESRSQSINRSRRKRIPKKVYLAVASIFIVLIIASFPQNGAAFSRWSELLHKVQGSTVQLLGGSGEQSEDPTNFSIVEDSGPITEQMSLEEAQKVTNFTILIPTVPLEFQLEQVTVMREGNQKSDEIYLNYVGKDRGFIVAEKKLDEQYAFGATMDSEDTQVEETLVNGQKASIIIFKNGVHQLIWMTQNNFFYIEGKITKEEVLKIAESI